MSQRSKKPAKPAPTPVLTCKGCGTPLPHDTRVCQTCGSCPTSWFGL